MGIVNRVADGYIGLLVLGFINAVIRASHIRAELQPRMSAGCWASTKTSDHRIEGGDAVVFEVAALERHGPFVSLTGSLLRSDTGNTAHVKWVAAKKVKKAKKKGKSRDGVAPTVVEEDVADQGAAEEPLPRKKKSKEIGGEEGGMEAEEDTVKDKKRKKQTAGDGGGDGTENKKKKKRRKLNSKPFELC